MLKITRCCAVHMRQLEIEQGAGPENGAGPGLQQSGFEKYLECAVYLRTIGEECNIRQLVLNALCSLHDGALRS